MRIPFWYTLRLQSAPKHFLKYGANEMWEMHLVHSRWSWVCRDAGWAADNRKQSEEHLRDFKSWPTGVFAKRIFNNVSPEKHPVLEAER
jgi:hypothetical protein